MDDAACEGRLEAGACFAEPGWQLGIAFVRIMVWKSVISDLAVTSVGTPCSIAAMVTVSALDR